MANKRLAVFVHGWGADAKNWWGTTETSLRAHPLADGIHFYFHRYPTTKRPEFAWWRKARQFLVKAPAHEAVGNIGQTLWSCVRDEYEKHGCSEVVLLGHSFGGIVIADAIRHAAERKRDGSAPDSQALGAVVRIALCASPIAGAALAATYKKATVAFGENIHVRNLLSDDPKRQQAADAFVSFLRAQGAPKLTLFYAANDEVVDREEAFGIFKIAKILYAESALIGRHSDCIANVGPTSPDRSENFEKVARWVFLDGAAVAVEPASSADARAAAATAAIAPAPAKGCEAPDCRSTSLGEARRVRENFRRLTTDLEKSLAAEPLLSWKQLRTTSTGVRDQYVLRVFLQQLNFAASRIDKALLSSNLWVAHNACAELHLRSEEREGYFTTEQLLVHTPGQVSIRANKVFKEPSSFEQNSAGSRAFLRGEPIVVAVEESKFPSEGEKETGVTHILGIPLYCSSDIDQASLEKAEGLPLAITVDFHFDGDPTDAQASELRGAGRELMLLFAAFRKRWPQEWVRLE